MYSQLGHHLYCTEMQNYIIFKNAQKIVIASYVVGSSNETDIIQYVDTEANIATEVSLTILDLLCLYTLNHQVCFAVLLSALKWCRVSYAVGERPQGSGTQKTQNV